jgi:hypothetical protein
MLRGQENLAEYRFGRDAIGHFFCRTCGVKPFGRGEMEAMGGVFYGVNIACLDDLTPSQLGELPSSTRTVERITGRLRQETGYL